MFIGLISILLVSCNTTEPNEIIKTNAETDFDTSVQKNNEFNSTGISDEDYEKYNEIMDYLYANPNVSEDKLFQELESTYNQSAQELKNFLQEKRMDVIDRDNGKTTEGEEKLNKNDVTNNIEDFFNKNVEDTDLLELSTSSADVEITNSRALAKGELKYDKQKFDYILKLEYHNDFQNAEVFQLKIDNEDISL